MATTRTDIHAPSNFDPRHYSFVGLIYTGSLEDAWQDPSDPEAREFVSAHDHVGVHGIGQCDHCGARTSYSWVWHYEGPGAHGWIVAGSDCSFGRFQCPDRATFELASLRKRVAGMREYGKKSAAVRKALAEHPELAEAIEWANDVAPSYEIDFERAEEQEARQARVTARLIGYNVSTIRDIASKLFRYGSISPKQEAFAVKLAAEGARKMADAKRIAEAVAAMAPLAAGRAVLEGMIKSVKWVDNGFGGIFKMAVALDSGHVVYGSVPSGLLDSRYDDVATLRGQRVRFTATVDPKVGDNDFAVFSRPSKAQLLTTEGSCAA
jgi:hypothetical protein